MFKAKKNYFISFIGGIGAGKTTAMALVAKKMGFTPVREQFKKNDFLPLFYKEPKKWALASQLFYLSEKIDQLLRIKETLKTAPVVLDVDINQDLCYLETQKILGNINRSEYDFYWAIYKKVKLVLPRPDLIVYLESNSAVLKKRIGERRRSYEKEIPQAYLQALVRAQEQWRKKNRRSLPLITIDAQKLNFADKPRDQEAFIRAIKKGLLL